MSNWIGGCSCHAELFEAGGSFTCNEKGRRIQEAYSFGVGELRAILDECNSWAPETFGFEGRVFEETQACCRFAFALGMEKLEFLNCVPWLFARMNQPGVRALCVQQWESSSPSDHCALTVSITDPAGKLRSQFDAIEDDGSGVSFELVSLL